MPSDLIRGCGAGSQSRIYTLAGRQKSKQIYSVIVRLDRTIQDLYIIVIVRLYILLSLSGLTPASSMPSDLIRGCGAGS
ncbi:MAG: hypothetical protein CVV37_05840, partial [Nitrospira bacterium HGW-Nitrospira-1]